MRARTYTDFADIDGTGGADGTDGHGVGCGLTAHLTTHLHE